MPDNEDRLWQAVCGLRIDLAGAWTDCYDFIQAFGCAVLNVSVLPGVRVRRRNYDLLHTIPVPPGSGMGLSGALNAARLAVLREEAITDCSPTSLRHNLVQDSWKFERQQGIIGGFQDQASAVFGGINVFTASKPRLGGDILIQQYVPPVVAAVDWLFDHIVVICGQASRDSSNVHRDLWQRFNSGDKDTIAALLSLKHAVHPVLHALKDCDAQMLGKMLSSQYRTLCQCVPSHKHELLDFLLGQQQNWLLGGKACGAGGGGCAVLVVNDKQQAVEACDVFGIKRVPCSYNPYPLICTEGWSDGKDSDDQS